MYFMYVCYIYLFILQDVLYLYICAQEQQLGVNFDSYLLFLVKNTSRCRMDVPSSSKDYLASRQFFDPGHETQLQREVFFTNQNVYFFHDFPPKRVLRKRIKKNFDEKIHPSQEQPAPTTLFGQHKSCIIIWTIYKAIQNVQHGYISTVMTILSSSQQVFVSAF